jgi:hypothetical protein
MMTLVRRFLVGAGAGLAVGALALFSQPPEAAEGAFCPHLGCDGPDACQFMSNTKCEDNPPPCVYRACELRMMSLPNGGG